MSFAEKGKLILEELDTVLSNVDESQILKAIQVVNESDKVFFNALGRASFAGKSFVMRLMHMGREVYVVGETNTPNFGEKDLLIICSGSGETKQFIQIAEKAKAFGGKILVLTGNGQSTLARMADATIEIHAPSKKQSDSDFSSIQPMASLFEQSILVIGDAIILMMMDSGSANEDMFHRHSNLE